MTEYFATGGDLYQWDIGRKVSLALPEGETASVVEFTINNEANALVVDVNDNEAEIPNVLLQTAGGLRMWAVTVTADGRQTRRYGSAPVYSRAKPDDYIYTETEVKRYEDFEDRLKALEENGGGAVESVNGQTGAVKLTAADVGAIPVDKPGTIKSTGVLIAGDGQPHYARMEGGDGRAMFSMRDKDGNILNRVSLRETETTLGQPLAINSGGHGGKTAAEGRENLSMYSKAEVDSKVAKIEDDVGRLSEEKIDKGSPIAHQQLVTDIEGNTVWEEKLAYDAQCFEWDGNEEGREIYKGAMADSYVFISDVVPSITELNQRCVLTINKKGTETIETITGDDIVEAISGMTVVDTRVYILTEDGINAIRDGQMQSYWPFTKPGIWFMWDTAGNSWPSKFEYGNSKTIDPKYLPKAVAVADAAGDTPTAAEFNALLTALRNAGYLST